MGIYKNEMYFPEGCWKDFWTGEVIEGGGTETVSWPADRGGALYVRAGAIVPFGPIMQYRKERPLDEIELYIYPSAELSQFDLYEDDGVSLDHTNGAFATTRTAAQMTEDAVEVTIAAPTGDLQQIPAGRRWGFRIALDQAPKQIVIDGDTVEDGWRWDAERAELMVDAVVAGPVKMRVVLSKET